MEINDSINQGEIDNEDLTNIRETIVSSGLLTPKEIMLYFNDGSCRSQSVK